MSEITIRVGGDATEDGAAFAEAWQRIQKGDRRQERSVAFETWEGLARVMTAERLRLLRSLNAQPSVSIAALARTLDRQYRRVHEDVAILTDVGLLTRQDGAIHATAHRIQAIVELT